MKKTFFSVAILATLLFSACKNNDPLTDKGVVINGVTWATRNVGSIGTFMPNPGDYGNYYTWQEAQNVCPSGWRLPTKSEFETLINANSTWTTKNGKNGRKFGNGSNTIFMPAAGYRNGGISSPTDVDNCGYYWSSTVYNNSDAYNWFFHSDVALLFYQYKTDGFSVRCVKE